MIKLGLFSSYPWGRNTCPAQQKGFLSLYQFLYLDSFIYSKLHFCRCCVSESRSNQINVDPFSNEQRSTLKNIFAFALRSRSMTNCDWEKICKLENEAARGLNQSINETARKTKRERENDCERDCVYVCMRVREREREREEWERRRWRWEVGR